MYTVCTFLIVAVLGLFVSPGPVPLLPKLPPMQTYALIPIQGGVPVLPSQPVMVSPIAANTSVDSQQQQSMMVSMGLSDDRQTPQSHDSSAASGWLLCHDNRFSNLYTFYHYLTSHSLIFHYRHLVMRLQTRYHYSLGIRI